LHIYIKPIEIINYINSRIGFDALGYQEHIDYGLVQSTNPEFNKATIRVNIERDHRQIIQVYHFAKKLISSYT